MKMHEVVNNYDGKGTIEKKAEIAAMFLDACDETLDGDILEEIRKCDHVKLLAILTIASNISLADIGLNHHTGG